MTPNERKQAIIAALDRWIRQRPGLEFGNYGDWKAYRAESRSITKDLHHARALLRVVELSSVSADQLMAAFPRAYSGRLEVKENDDGSIRLDYCTEQYWPCEYRRAVCAVLASALWDHYRKGFAASAKPGESPGDAIRRNFRSLFNPWQHGRTLASRWFD